MATSTILSNRPTRETGTSSLSGVTASQYVAYKDKNGNCRVDFYARSSSDMAGGSVLFNLSNDFKPKFNSGGIALATTSSNASVAGTVAINTNGEILVPSLSSTTRGVYGHIEYQTT